MKVTLQYDPGVDVWTIAGTGVRLRTRTDIDAWRAELMSHIKSLGQSRDFVLMDVTGMEVAVDVKDAYGHVFAELVRVRVRDVLRYGRPVGLTGTVMMLEAAKHVLAPQLFDDRQAALRMLALLRARGAAC